MHEQVVAGRGIAGRADMYATPLLDQIRRVQVTYRIDWGHAPGTLELGPGQWQELFAVLSEVVHFGDCLKSDPPQLWGMRLVVVPGVSGLMAKP